MAQIGNLGKLITFEVSSKRVRTFKNMSQTVKGRWATHDVIKGKPKSEFLGPGQRAMTLTIHLSSSLGVKPRSIIDKMEKAVEKGTPYPLVIGGKKVGSYQWVITDMSETWETIIMDGVLVSANLSLTLAEYV